MSTEKELITRETCSIAVKESHTQHLRTAKHCSDKMTSIISSKTYDVSQSVDQWFVCVSGFDRWFVCVSGFVLYLTASYDGAVIIAP